MKVGGRAEVLLEPANPQELAEAYLAAREWCDEAPERELRILGGGPSAVATLVIGIAQLSAPFKGGVLVPALDVTVFTTSSGAGGFVLPFRTPAGLPSGFEIWAQCAIQDAAAINGVALSNAVLGVSP